MVGKGVKLKDVIFHIVHLLLLLLLNTRNSITILGQNLKFCTVVDFGGKMCSHTKKFVNPLLSVSH